MKGIVGHLRKAIFNQSEFKGNLLQPSAKHWKVQVILAVPSESLGAQQFVLSPEASEIVLQDVIEIKFVLLCAC